MPRCELIQAASFAQFDETVVRDALGVPAAFRIWRAGENPTDKGSHIFSDRSAELILADQAARGNLYSIDIDHSSLNPQAPLENHRAVGWHRLAVRDGELWAVDVDWTPEIRKSFEAAALGATPEWRYFSPAYGVDKDTREIISYLNLALTNNPATHNVTALATAVTSPLVDSDDSTTIMASPQGDDSQPIKANKAMPKYLDDARKALSALSISEDVDEAKRARKALAALDVMPPKKGDDGDGDEDDDDSEDKKKATEDEEDKKKMAADGEDAEDKKATAVLAAQELTRQNVAATARLAALETELATMRAEKAAKAREAVLAARGDISAELRTELLKPEHSDAHVTAVLAAIPPSPVAALTAAAKATRGEENLHVDGLSYRSEYGAELDRRMGMLTAARPGVKSEGVFQYLGVSELAKKDK